MSTAHADNPQCLISIWQLWMLKLPSPFPKISPSICLSFQICHQRPPLLSDYCNGLWFHSTSWQHFWHTIEVMTSIYSTRTDIVETHSAYLDMIVIEDPAPKGTYFPKARIDYLNPGVLNKDRKPQPGINFNYVNDCLLASIRQHARSLLAACIEAIYTVLGHPDTALWQCPLAMDKWVVMHNVGHRVIQIGLDQIIIILDESWPERKANLLSNTLSLWLVSLYGLVLRRPHGSIIWWYTYTCPLLTPSVEMINFLSMRVQPSRN